MQGLGSRGLGFGSDPAHLDDFGIVRLHEPLLVPLPLDSPLTLTPRRVLEPAGAKTERLGHVGSVVRALPVERSILGI